MKYKVGDFVRTTKSEDECGVEVFPIGTIGIITKISNDAFPPIKVETGNDFFHYSEDMLEPFKTYEQGLEDAWELLRNAYDMKPFEVAETFGGSIDTFYDVIRLTPQEAFKKWEAYEKSQKIEVGDVVETTDLVDVFRGIVLDDDGLDCYIVMDENGSVNATRKTDVRKTGKHIDITSILEQIREV